jgi:hypothetical protein
MDNEIYFEAITPLNVKVRTTRRYWDYIVTIKHRPMKNKEDIVKKTLLEPDEIYRSTIDPDVFLYYRQFDRIYCVVVKHMGKEGFLITAYPTDNIKEGERTWKK